MAASVREGEYRQRYPGRSGVQSFSAYLFNIYPSDVINEHTAHGVLIQRQSQWQSFSSED